MLEGIIGDAAQRVTMKFLSGHSLVKGRATPRDKETS